jgi:hypothetical protein
MVTLALLVLTQVSDVKLSAVTPSGSQRLTFADVKGLHTVYFTLEPMKQKPLKGEEGFSRSRTLTVTHTLAGKPVWEAKDFVLDCRFDLTLDLLAKSIEVTDLDQNGEAEVSFAYTRGCRSDVSPLELKLLLYQGATKYALRGTTKVTVGKDAKGAASVMGGELEADFDGAPPALLDHTKTRWALFVGP